MVTIAPELDGAMPAIEYLASQGVTVALGHTGADASTTRTAIAAGVARLTSNGLLAGSTLTMDQAFLNLINNFDFSIAQAVHATSTLAATRVGLNNVGSIEVGKNPDFIELSADGRVKLIS